ncbi:MAG: hypothetical protein QXL94_00705 [Candidatus Parvarchaeum sp.]
MTNTTISTIAAIALLEDEDTPSDIIRELLLSDSDDVLQALEDAENTINLIEKFPSCLSERQIMAASNGAADIEFSNFYYPLAKHSPIASVLTLVYDDIELLFYNSEEYREEFGFTFPRSETIEFYDDCNEVLELLIDNPATSEATKADAFKLMDEINERLEVVKYGE